MKIYRGSTEICDVYLKDNTFTIDEIMGEQTLTINFLSLNVIQFNINDYITIGGITYKIRYSEKVTKRETSLGWEYNIVFYSKEYDTNDVEFFLHATPERKKNYDYYTGTASQWLTLLVNNMNRNGSGWTAGSCIDSEYVTLSFKDKTVSGVLDELVKELDTEYWIYGQVINIGKQEISNNGIVLGQGEGMGFKELTLTAVDETPPITVLYPYGSDKNLGSDYGHDYLVLPGGALSIQKNVDKYGIIEASVQFDKIFPHGKYTISNKIDDFTLQASDIDFNLTDCLIEGSEVLISFQDGGLAGYDLNIVDGSWDNSLKQLKLKQNSEENALKVPGDINFSVGDHFFITGIKMPQKDIDNAQNELLTESQTYLEKRCEKKIQLSGKCDDILFKSQKLIIRCGQMVTVYSPKLNINRDIRVTKVKRYIENNGELSYRFELTLSDFLQTNGFKNIVDDVKNTPEKINKTSRQNISFTRRTFQNAIETQQMLENVVNNYSSGINPKWIRTMSILLGYEPLQFRFISTLPSDRTILSNTIPAVEHNFDYNSDTQVFSTNAGVIQHMTIGVKNLSSAHHLSEYMFWSLPAFTYNVSGMSALYVYAKCSKTVETGEFLLSETAIELEGIEGYYHLLIGTLSSSSDGTRSFVRLYGFAELTPGALIIDRIISPDGYQYLDFLAKATRIGDADSYIKFGNKRLEEKGMIVVSGSGATDYIEVDRGKFDENSAYYVGEKVKYLGSYYKNIKDCEAGVLPTDTTYWKIIVAAGDTGEAGFSAVLTNEAITLPSDSSGNITSYTNGSSTGIKLYEGSAEITSGLTYSYSPSTGITLGSWTSSSSSVSITGFSNSYDTGYVDCTITYKGISYTKRCVVGKMKQGSTGSSGISYWLACSDAVVNDTVITTTSGKSHSYLPATIYFYPRKRIGSADPIAANDCKLTVKRYYNNTSDTPYNNQTCSSMSYSVDIPSGFTSIVGSMYYGNILVDTFTIVPVETGTSMKDELAKKMGYNDWSTMVSDSEDSEKILMIGGYLNAKLIQAQAILTAALSVTDYANLLGTQFGEEGVKIAQNRGLTLTGTGNSGNTTTLALTPSSVGIVSNFANKSGSVSGSSGWPAFNTKAPSYLSSTSGNCNISNITKLSYSSFSISGSLTNYADSPTSYEVYVHLYICNSTGILSDSIIGVARIKDESSFSVSVSANSISVPLNATYVYAKAEFIAGSSMTSFSINIDATSISFTSGSGAQKSILGVDGYGVYLDALNYLHWGTSSDGLRLSFMGKSYSIPVMLFAAHVNSGGGFTNYTGATVANTVISGNNYSPSATVDNQHYTITHNIYSIIGITANNTIVQCTPLSSSARRVQVYSISNDYCIIATPDGTCEFYILIIRIA